LVQLKIATSFNDIKANISSLREETKADIHAIHDELAVELARLRLTQAETVSNVEEMGNTLSKMMDRVTALEQSHQVIAKECKKLQDKCLDLENRSRRQNLHLVGIKEGAEGGNITRFLTEFFPEVLGAEIFDSPVMIDSLHRTLALRPAAGETPRAILVRLHYYTDNFKILDLGKAKGSLMYKGAQVHIFPQMSPEVTKLRAAFNPVKRKLCETNIGYSLFYRARLAITVDGVRHSFDSL
ncbi:hypothetical protein cypCar_00036760, partial [Cyprinus carpio]